MQSTIKLGLVTDHAPIEDVVDGWDYYEIPNALHVMPFESEVNWKRSRDRYRARGVPTPVSSHYTQRFGLSASGPSYDRHQQMFWAERSFRRLHEIGVRVVGVYGGFFSNPADYPEGKALDDARSFCNILADHAEQYDMQIALEPNANPQTLFPSYGEGLAFARSLGRRSVRLMVDLNYFLKLGEPLESIDPDYCLHVHMAGDHSQPNLNERSEAYDHLFTALKNIGYTGTVSVASPWRSTRQTEEVDFAYETEVTLKYMQKLRERHFG